MKRVLDKLGDFVLGKGFYIVLLLCVATIGVSGYYLIDSFQPNADRPVTGTPEVVLPDEAPAQKTTPSIVLPQQQEQTEPAPKPVPQTQTPAPQTVQRPVAPSAPTYCRPLEGEVLREFSKETLAYDETMGDWRTHAGVDIAAEAGTEVVCVCDGVVKAVYTDDLMGVTVVVDHQNGVVSTYANLAEAPAAAQGQEVEGGSILGKVGTTALAEKALPTHLHLEMTENGEPVDPVGFFPIEK